MVLALGACSSAGTAKLSSKSLCENSGGRYTQGVCQPGTARKAADMCQGFGGLYLVNWSNETLSAIALSTLKTWFGAGAIHTLPAS